MPTTKRHFPVRPIESLLLLLAFASTLAQATPAEPWIIGHRGLGHAVGTETENSISALRAAFAQGAAAVEFDVQLTRDNQVVLAHDPRLERISTGKGCVAEKTLGELHTFRLRDGDGNVRDEEIPTLRKALLAIRAFDSPLRPFLADIHIKVYDGFHGDHVGLRNGGCAATRYRELVSAVLEITQELKLQDRILFTSFDPRALDLIRTQAPLAHTGLLSYYGTERTIQRAAHRYQAVAIRFVAINPKKVRIAHANHLLVLSWSPADTKDILRLIARDGVDGVITNDIGNAEQAARSLPKMISSR